MTYRLPLVELPAPFVPEVDEADELDDEVSSEDVSPGFALQPQPAVDTRRIPASSKQHPRAQRDTFPYGLIFHAIFASFLLFA